MRLCCWVASSLVCSCQCFYLRETRLITKRFFFLRIYNEKNRAVFCAHHYIGVTQKPKQNHAAHRSPNKTSSIGAQSPEQSEKKSLTHTALRQRQYGTTRGSHAKTATEPNHTKDQAIVPSGSALPPFSLRLLASFAAALHPLPFAPQWRPRLPSTPHASSRSSPTPLPRSPLPRAYVPHGEARARAGASRCRRRGTGARRGRTGAPCRRSSGP